MKSVHIIISILIVLVYSCNRSKEPHKKDTPLNNYTIRGHIKGISSGMVFLKKLEDHQFSIIDSASIVDSRYKFNGKVEYPERYFISFDYYEETFICILENALILIESDLKDLENPVIKGSELNKIYASFNRQSKQIFKEIRYLFPDFQRARLENDLEKLKTIEHQINAIEQKNEKFIYSFIDKHSTSPVSIMLLSDLLLLKNPDTVKIADYFKMFPAKLKQLPDARKIAKKLRLN